MLRLSGAAVTHRGLVRSDNEDSAFCGADLVLVADGVGGGAAGEVASATAAHVVCATAMADRDGDPVRVLTEGVRRAQALLARGVQEVPDRAGMATTLTAVLTNGRRCAIAHIGDSRGYVHRDRELVRVTRDHTWVAGMLESGRLDEATAREHPWRNVVLRSLSGEEEAAADITALDLHLRDRVLLCSDGLTDLVDEDRIAGVLDAHDDEDAATLLRDDALMRGGRDNITVVVASVLDGPRVEDVGRLLGAVCDPGNIVDVTSAVADPA